MNYRDYLSCAERYLLRAEHKDEQAADVTWLLIPATILAWAAIEAFVNNMLDDFSSLPPNMFELHERAFLLEKRLVFVDRGDKIGQFDLRSQEYRRVADKIFFLIAKFGIPADQNIKGDDLWNDFQKFKDARDGLVHPRRGRGVSLDITITRGFIGTAKRIIQLVSQHVWGREVKF
jgi:hypothetical protein